jgi:hypothetical protein
MLGGQMKKPNERIVAFIFGVVFVMLILALAIWKPNPSPFQYTVFRIVLALAAAGVAAMLPGFIELTVPGWIRAGGALAVFLIVYFYSPVAMTGVTPKSEAEVEIEKPVVRLQLTSENHLTGLMPLSSAVAEEAAPLPTLVVTRADALLDTSVSQRRYQRIVITGVKAKVPDRAALVANEIEGEQGGSLIGKEFSIVARRLANITINVGGDREPGAEAGEVRLYAKTIENAIILANGSNGTTPSQAGPRGTDGTPSQNGRDGVCDGFGAYRGATPAQAGGDAGDGQRGLQGGVGKPGGSVVVTTIRDPIGTTFNVSGGSGGAGGPGGPPGTPGAAATGGRGCTGLGGSQPNQADAPAARVGATGPSGPPGDAGTAGERRLVLVKSFDPILVKLKAYRNDQLHAALRSP